MRALIWRPEARADLLALVEYLSARDPDVAALTVSRIEDAARALIVRDTGRPGRVDGAREKSVPRTSHILAYELVDRGEAGELHIVRVIHSSRHWPGRGWPSGEP